MLNEKPPLSTNKSNDFVELTSSVLTDYTGKETKPSETKLAHTTNESVLIQEFYDAIDIYSHLINRYFS